MVLLKYLDFLSGPDLGVKSPLGLRTNYNNACPLDPWQPKGTMLTLVFSYPFCREERSS